MGKIVLQADPPAKTWPDGQFGITPPTPLLVSSEIVHEATNEMLPSEPRFPSHPEYLPQYTPGRTQGLTTDADRPTKVKEAIAHWRDRIPNWWDLPNAGSELAHDHTQRSEVRTV